MNSQETISHEDFRWLQAWLKERSGIVLEDGRKFLAEKRLVPLLWRQRLPGMPQLMEVLRDTPQGPVAKDALEVLSNGETWFFRDAHPFESLRNIVIPQLIRARSGQRSLTLWAAGCATGQELYSLALLLRHNFPVLKDDGWKLTLLGTDVNEDALERARKGLFTREEVNRGLPVAMLVRHFEKEGDSWRIKPEYRSMVEFKVGRADLPSEDTFPCDLVFLRNLLYSFDQETRRATLARVRERLAPGGALFLGLGERSEIVEGLEEVEAGRGWYYKRS